jgi:gamma-glutamylcyclotransferase (GGCT)/AIG2-like uncharacterized protein YtfP
MQYPENYPIAVYGSLRTGGGNDHLWNSNPGVTVLGTGTLRDVSLRFEHHGFPYGITQTGSAAVTEVLHVSGEAWPELIWRMDRLEGHPDFYTRILATAYVGGSAMRVWTYVVQDPYYRGLPAVPENDWRTINREVVDWNVGCTGCGIVGLPLAGHASVCSAVTA